MLHAVASNIALKTCESVFFLVFFKRLTRVMFSAGKHYACLIFHFGGSIAGIEQFHHSIDDGLGLLEVGMVASHRLLRLFEMVGIEFEELLL